MALSQKDIMKLAQDAGFNQLDSRTASAIAIAESGGDPNAHNTKPPDDSYGLWQINMLGTLGPARRKQFGISTNDQLFDPKTNAHAAWVVFKNAGYKFTPWTTFTSGAYKDKIDTGNVGKVAETVTDAASQFSGVTSAINNIGQNVFKGLANIVGVAIAIVLLIGAIVIMAMQTKSGKSVVKGVTKVL